MTITKTIGRGPALHASAQSVGRSTPLGASVVEDGVNFSLFSRTAAGTLIFRPIVTRFLRLFPS